MARFKKSDFKPASDWINELPAERLEKIEAGAANILQEMHLAEMRKALSVPQTGVAKRSGLKQGEVSRIEKSPETVQMRTLSRYIGGLGAKMKIVVEFPDGTQAEMPLRAGRMVKSRLKVGTVLPVEEKELKAG